MFKENDDKKAVQPRPGSNIYMFDLFSINILSRWDNFSTDLILSASIFWLLIKIACISFLQNIIHIIQYQ